MITQRVETTLKLDFLNQFYSTKCPYISQNPLKTNALDLGMPGFFFNCDNNRSIETPYENLSFLCFPFWV